MKTNSMLRLLAVIASAELAVVAGCHDAMREVGRRPEPGLHLTLKRVIPVRARGNTAGAFIRDDGRVLAWTFEGALLAEEGGVLQVRRQLKLDGTRLLEPIGGWDDAGEFEIVQKRRVALMRQVGDRRTFKDDPQLRARARVSEDELLLWFRDTSIQQERVVRRRRSERDQALAVKLPLMTDSVFDAALAADSLRMFSFGFADQLVCSVSSKLHDGSTADAQGSFSLDAGAVAKRSGWIMASAVLVDSAVLLTFSELSSDRRRIIRVSERCEPVGSVTMDQPVAFISSTAKSKTLLAARNIDGQEILVYTWSWGAGALARHNKAPNGGLR